MASDVKLPGVMSQAMVALENRMQMEFSINSISLRVLKSNTRAVNFYTKLGYELKEEISLIESHSHDRSDLIPGTPAVDYFLKMDKFFNLLDSNERVLTAGPNISELEISYVNNAVTDGWNNHHSDYISKFESEFAEFVGAKYAMATSSCSGALHLALLALGIGPGDEVLVPDITWVATASAVAYTGAKPIFVDIDLNSWMLSAVEIEKHVNVNTKAIIPVHLYGYAAPMLQISELARKYGLHVVEDAAPAIGTSIGGKLAGTFGDIGCYSFQGAKLLVTGEGGMLVTDNKDLFERAKKDQDHGRKPGTFWIEQIGHKYKMNNVTAALGLGQLQRVENQIFRKREINHRYVRGLSHLPFIKFQAEIENSESICWMSSFRLTEASPITRDILISELSKRNIDSRPVFPAISQYRIWGYTAVTPPNSKVVGNSAINLPSGVRLSDNTVDRVIANIDQILNL